MFILGSLFRSKSNCHADGYRVLTEIQTASSGLGARCMRFYSKALVHPLIVGLCVVGAVPTRAEMISLGTLDGGTHSSAYAVNAGGNTVVGDSGSAAVPDGEAFRWTYQGGMLGLGTLAGGFISAAFGVSADGNVIVGESESNDGLRAFIWTQVDGMKSLGTLAGGTYSRAFAVSGDGRVVVGTGDSDNPDIPGEEAFRWTQADGMIGLGTLEGGTSSQAWGVSADGSVVVGISGGILRAFRWTASTGMVSLGTLKGGLTSQAFAVSADGRVIVGQSGSTAFPDAEGFGEAFRWTKESGMVGLGALQGDMFSEALDVSADGSVIVGWSGRTADSDGEAFAWTQQGGMVGLGTLTGGSSSRAFGVSADGRIIVGRSASTHGDRAFIWRLGTMEDLANLFGSFPVLADDNAVAAEQHQGFLRGVMRRSGVAGAGRTAITMRAETIQTQRNPSRIGARLHNLASFGFAHGVTDHLTLGANVAFNDTRLRNNGFEMSRGFGLGVWGRYSAGGEARTGLQLGTALGYAKARAEIARGENLQDVVVARGRAGLRTQAAQFSLGYGVDLPSAWLVTPRLTLAHYSTRRAAYEETGAVFNGSYAASHAYRTDMTLDVSAERPVSQRGRVSFTAGFEHTLNKRLPRLVGISDFPFLPSFNMGSNLDLNRMRPFVSMGYMYELNNGASLSGDLRIGRAAYGKSPTVGIGTSYTLHF